MLLPSFRIAQTDSPGAKRVKICINSGPVHTNAFSFLNADISVRFQPIRSNTLIVFTENASRSFKNAVEREDKRNTPSITINVDGRKRIVLKTMTLIRSNDLGLAADIIREQNYIIIRAMHPHDRGLADSIPTAGSIE